MNHHSTMTPPSNPYPVHGVYSSRELAKSVVRKTGKYTFNLFVLPSHYFANIVLKVSTFAGRTVGFVTGLSLGALVGTCRAIHEGLKGSDFKTASKKITEYAVNGCVIGNSAGYLAFAVATTPLTLIAGLCGFVVSASLIFEAPVASAVIVCASLGTAILATCELAQRNWSRIDDMIEWIKVPTSFTPMQELGEEWSKLKLAVNGLLP